MSCLGNPYYDSVGSLGVGTLLGTVSAFLIYTNTEALLGRSIQPEQLQRLTELLESDPVVRWESLQLKNSTEQQKQENNIWEKSLKRSLLVLSWNLSYWDFRMLAVTNFCAKGFNKWMPLRCSTAERKLHVCNNSYVNSQNCHVT